MFSVLTILVVIFIIIITAQNITKENRSKPETSMFNPSSTQTPTPTSSTTPFQTPSDSPTIIPPTLTPTLSPTPINIPSNESQSVLDFKYPNSTIISKNEKEATFESTNDPKKVTDWYKDKIKDMGMNTTSFVQTNTNGNILNKLVGANGNREVMVEINKKNNSQTVNISVSLSP